MSRFQMHVSRLHLHMNVCFCRLMHVQWQEDNKEKQNLVYAK